MTNKELERLEGLAEIAKVGTRMGAPQTKERFEAITEVCQKATALVAEVRQTRLEMQIAQQHAQQDAKEIARLRGLVQKAYAEGQFTTSYYGNGYIDTQPWDESDACKALNADKTPQDGVS